MNKVLIIESDEATANEMAALIKAQGNLESVRASDLQSAKEILETDPEVKIVFSLYEVSDKQEDRRDFFVQNFISENRKDIRSFSVGTIDRKQIVLSENKALLFTAEALKASLEATIIRLNEVPQPGTPVASPIKEECQVEKKKVLLLTDVRDSEFSKNILSAADISGLEVSISSPNFLALKQIKEGKVGVIVVDLEELKQQGNDFHRTIRMFHLTTPMLLAGSNMIFLDQTMTHRFERKIEPVYLSELLNKSISFSEMIDETEAEFFKRIEEIRHLTGDELMKAKEKIQKEIFSEIYFAKTQKIELKKNSIKSGFIKTNEKDLH